MTTTGRKILYCSSNFELKSIQEFVGFRTSDMAQFTVGGSLKSLFNGDGFPNGFDSSCRPIKVKALRRGGRSSRFKTLFSVPRERKVKLSLVRAIASDDSGSSLSDGRINFNEVFDEIMEEDTEFEIDELEGFRGLVVDISYRPVNVVCWKRAICLEFMDKADVLEYYDQTINSPSGSYYIPAVLRVQHLLQVRRRKVKTGLSRKRIFHRDNFMCQYCSSRENLTIDHVLPISRGGKWTWENLVAACQKCNSKKGQKTLEEANMKLMKIPKAPKDYDILAIPVTNHAIRMLKMRKGMPEEWRQYLSNPHGAP